MATPHPKFTFDTEFFEVVGGAVAGKPITAPSTPGPRNPETIRQQAYAEGHAAGLVEGQQQAQADLARMQQHLQSTLHALQETVTQREAQLLNLLLGLLQGTLEHVLGHAAQHYGPEVLEHHLRQLLPLVKTDEALTLRIHPSAQGYHEKLGLPHANILGLALRIIPDASLGAVDASMEWQHGGVEARLAEHGAAIQQLLAAAGATPLPKPIFSTAATPVPTALPTPPLASPTPATPTPVANDPLTAAEQERKARAAALLGDDDLVDALK